MVTCLPSPNLGKETQGRGLLGVLARALRGKLLDQVAIMGQRPIVTSVNVPYSLQFFTDGRSPGIREITRKVMSMMEN